MDNNISDLVKNFSDMIKNNSNENTNTSSSTNSNKNQNGFDFSKISPEMLNSLSSFMNSNSSGESGEKPNIDINTFLKMKSVMEKMNSKDDPRSKLLLSLKPYLKESRKSKVDQYISLFNIGNVMDIFGASKRW